MLVGHQEVTTALSRSLPPVSVITGPPSVGKRLIATYAAMVNDVARVDFIQVPKLTVEAASRVKQFMQSTPAYKYKFALIDVDDAHESAVNKLLKALEEPPSYARFSLISSAKLPRTLRTRGHKYSVGLLAPTELEKILLSKGLSANEAVKFSHLGRVDLALEAYADVASKTAALNVLQAVELGDYDLFCQSFKAVDDKAAAMILTAWQESAVGKWTLFNPQYLGEFAKQNVALSLLSRWSNISSARPKLAVRTTLESVMKG